MNADSFRVLMQPIALPSQPYVSGLVDALRSQGARVESFNGRDAIRGDVDILHFHWPEFVIAGGGPKKWFSAVKRLAWIRLAKLRGAAVVLTAHNAKPHDRTLDRFDRWYFGVFDGMVDHVLALTQAGVDEVRAHRPGLANTPWTHTRHGHYRAAFADPPDRAEARDHLGISPESRLVVFVGAVRRYKGVPSLIEAAGSADCELLIGGRCDEAQLRTQLESVAASHPNIHLRLRHLSDDDLAATIRAADLVVLPYRQVLNSGSALLALSLDRPLLLPRTLTFQELQDDLGANWVRLYDEQDLTTASLTDALAIESQGRSDLSDYAWEPIAAATMDGYRTAAGVLGMSG